jgi:hypothetical protein
MLAYRSSLSVVSVEGPPVGLEAGLLRDGVVAVRLSDFMLR